MLKLSDVGRSTQRWQIVRRSFGPALVGQAEKELPVLTGLYFLILCLTHLQIFQITAVVQSDSHSYFLLCTMPICVQKLLLLVVFWEIVLICE
jgi:hypothetical protein